MGKVGGGVGDAMDEIIKRNDEGVIGWRRWIPWPPIYTYTFGDAIDTAVRQGGARYCPVCRQFVIMCDHFGAGGGETGGRWEWLK